MLNQCVYRFINFFKTLFSPYKIPRFKTSDGLGTRDASIFSYFRELSSPYRTKKKRQKKDEDSSSLITLIYRHQHFQRRHGVKSSKM